MKFSQIAGTSLVPTLSRIVLALAFVTAGYNKLMRDAEFSSSQAATLQELGVSVVKVTQDSAGEATAALQGPQIVLASLQETPTKDPLEAAKKAVEKVVDDASEKVEDVVGEAGDAKEAANEKVEELIDDAVEELEEAGGGGAPVVTPPMDDGSTYTAKGVHSVTLLCHMNNWPVPKTMGYAAGITEFLGGGLILIGFLTRLSALGLASTMAVAFYFVSMNFYGVHTTSPFEFAMDHDKFHGAISQLALFVLAFGVFLTGAGPLSLDRLLFGRGGGGKKKGNVEIEFDEVDRGPTRAL